MAYTLTVLIFIGGFALLLGSVVWWSIKNGISPMPTTKKAKKALMSLLPQDQGGRIYELGSGWGTLLIPLAKFYKNSRVIGYETSPIPYFFSKVFVWAAGSANIEIHKKDFFDVPLSEASIIVCYLYPGAMRELKLKFEKELPPGAIVISNTFAVPGWTPDAIAESNDLYRTKIYLYKRE